MEWVRDSAVVAVAALRFTGERRNNINKIIETWSVHFGHFGW